MKKLLLTISVLIFLFSCTPESINDMIDNASNQIIDQTIVEEVPPINQQEILYDGSGNLIPDFIPALQPFVNEGCNTAWNNLSAIVNPDGSITYFTNLPDYTSDPFDYDKSRFTFIYQVQNPWYGIYPEENPYTMLQVNWYTLPIDDYGSLTCQGLQEVRTWVLDELTNKWYMNSQIVWAAVLCNGQGDCDQGWTFDQIEYTPYQSGYVHLVDGTINEF